MPLCVISLNLEEVALLAEGVDRNSERLYVGSNALESPSSRRAWIEIASPRRCIHQSCRRPPRGGRG